MRLLGPVDHYADRTTDSNMLSRLGLTSPEIMMQTANLFEGNFSTTISFLMRRGMMQSGWENMSTNDFQVIGNRQFKWRLEGPPVRKGRVMVAPAGSTPGLNQAEMIIVLDTDWFSINDNLETTDRDTTLFVRDKYVYPTGGTAYRCVLATNTTGAYCDPNLVAVGSEIGFSYTSFPEGSEDAGEKVTSHEWHTEWMGIQRMKYSYTGTAAHTKVGIMHNGEFLWDYKQNIDMMGRWMLALENQMLFGKSTMDVTGRCFVQDKQSRDIISGNGIIAQGEAALKYTYNVMNITLIERILSDLQLTATTDGVTEVAVVGGNQFHMQFQRMLRDILQQNPLPLVVDSGNGKAIETNFKYYQIGDVKLWVLRSPSFDAIWRPRSLDTTGVALGSLDAFFVNLGNTTGARPNLNLVTLGNKNGDRRFVRRTIPGMVGSSDANAASPVDASQTHILSENGVFMGNPWGFAQLKKARRS